MRIGFCMKSPKASGAWLVASGVVLMSVALVTGAVNAGSSVTQAPMRQDAIKVPAFQESAREVPQPNTPTLDTLAQMSPELPVSNNAIGYDPSGRRDPFAPVVQELQPGKADPNLPPLQRVTLTELNLVAIVWGAYGYTAMVQTPEGHGYTVRRGTRIGQNNGVVSAITERGIIVQERFTDVYGKKQEREYVKLLHPKEGSE
jgi:type IV pilus assembly protein PilP